MRVIVMGGRTYLDTARVRRELATLPQGAVIVHGNASTGADWIAEALAGALGMQDESHPAEWERPCTRRCIPNHRRQRMDGTSYCPGAGTDRDQKMLEAGADLVIAFPDGRGTADMVRRARRAGIPVREAS